MQSLPLSFNTDDGPGTLGALCWRTVTAGNNKLSANPELLLDLLLQLGAHKSMGPNGTYARVLKELVDVVVRPFSIIFQGSWETGEVPVDWKLEKCCPSFQEGKEGKTLVITGLSVSLQCLVKLRRRLFWGLLKNT